MVTAEITVYGANDAVLKQWSRTWKWPAMAKALNWCAEMAPVVSEFCAVQGAHFVDQHVHDHGRDHWCDSAGR